MNNSSSGVMLTVLAMMVVATVIAMEIFNLNAAACRSSSRSDLKLDTGAKFVGVKPTERTEKDSWGCTQIAEDKVMPQTYSSLPSSGTSTYAYDHLDFETRKSNGSAKSQSNKPNRRFTYGN